MNLDKVKELQEFIDKQEPFKIDGYEAEHQKDLEDFIKDFHQGPLSSRDNIFDNGEIMKRGKSRSLIDTLIVCKKHYNTTVEEVLAIFQKHHDDSTIYGHYCGDIQRTILRIDEDAKNKLWKFHPSILEYTVCKDLDIKFNDLFN